MRAFLLGAALLATACGSNDPAVSTDAMSPTDSTAPTDSTDPDDAAVIARDKDELATILAAHLRAEFPVQLIAAQLSRGTYPDGFQLTGTGVSGLEYTGIGATGSLSFSFSYFCHGEALPGDPPIPCDAAAHHSHFTLALTGSQTMGDISMTAIDRVVVWEIRDLALGKARISGPDALSLDTSVSTEGVQADYHLTFDAAYNQVRYLAGQAVPTFGTIAFTVTSDRTRGDDVRTFESTAQLTYGGNAAPSTIVLDGVTYGFDVAAGTVVRL